MVPFDVSLSSREGVLVENLSCDELKEFIQELEQPGANLRFNRLLRILTKAFGDPRISGSHHIFKTPWPGDPRINVQKQGSKVKPYQRKQVLQALHALSELMGC